MSILYICGITLIIIIWQRECWSQKQDVVGQ